MNDSKLRRRSKTVWLGVGVTAVSVLGLVAGAEWMQAYPEAVAVLGMVVGVLGVVLRHYTDRPLAR